MTIRNPESRKATLLQLLFIMYSVVCSGAYGLEEMVSASGPGLAMIILLVLPLVYATPMALVCSELASIYPVEGGYYRWVRQAFGDFAGYTVAWLVWLTMFATTASFAVLFADYLRFFVPHLPESVHFLAAAAMVWTAVLFNIRGISLIGTASVIFTLMIFIPFGVMTVMGAMKWQHSPITPLVNPEQPFVSALFSGVLLAMWLYGGFERMTVNAQEVRNPVRTFPLALLISVPLCALSYIIPTLAALAANGDWHEWSESYFMTAAAKIGGAWLGAAMALGGLISNAALIIATMLSQSRLPMVLAEDGLFPQIFQRSHRRFGTPTVSLIATGTVLTGLCALHFTELVSAYALVQSLAYIAIYAAFFRLRAEPIAFPKSRFRIPFGTAGLFLMFVPTFLIGVLVIQHGLFPRGSLDVRQALLQLLVFGSGPLTYMVMRKQRAGIPEQPDASPG